MTLRTNGERGDQCSFMQVPRPIPPTKPDGALNAIGLAFRMIDVERLTTLIKLANIKGE